MRDWLFKILFPRQYEQIKRFGELLKVGDSPDFKLTAPDGVYFKDITVYLVTDSQGSSINCQWIELSHEGVIK